MKQAESKSAEAGNEGGRECHFTLTSLEEFPHVLLKLLPKVVNFIIKGQKIKG